MKGTHTTVGGERTGARDGTRGGVDRLCSLNSSLEKRLDSNIGWRTRPCLSRNRVLDQGTSFRKEKKAGRCAHLTNMFLGGKGSSDEKAKGK